MIFSAFERMMAFRYLRARRQEGFISVIAGFSLLGIGLGVATLIVVMAVMNGFRQELFARILGLNGHIHVYNLAMGPLNDYQPIEDRLRALADVTDVSPTVEAQVLLTYQGFASGAMVRGVVPDDFRARPSIAGHVVDGNLADFEGGRVAIGRRMADRLHIQVGDSLTLISPRGSQTAFGVTPRQGVYEIAAIFEVGMYEYDNNFVFMPLDTAQSFFRLGSGVTALEIYVKDPQNLRALRPAIAAAAGNEVRLLDWQQSNASFVTALQVERNVMFLILTMIILVAAFNIISSLIMLVKDKGRDIAILRTMGASRGSIMRIFFLSGASIGVTGTVSGAALGILFASNIETIRQFIQGLTGTELFSAEIYFLSKLPAVIDWGEVVQVVLMALILSIGATLYPSWRAAKLDPVEALRYE
jgi:lipoprotein-releasing system permease protein